jgi:hypothetical protein
MSQYYLTRKPHWMEAFKAKCLCKFRRSGRDNAEGIRYSMSQWYPKKVEYDYQGWNANPYIAREFYGVWGNFDVNITIDKNYMLAANRHIAKCKRHCFGYEGDGGKSKTANRQYINMEFSAENVHDFVWAADPNYKMQSGK